MSALLAEVVRSAYVEGSHYGSVLALRADGSIALALGDLVRPIFPRSSNKPLQAIALLDAGWQPTREEHIALASSSHSGEPQHLALVQEVLGDLVLQTPELPPLNELAWQTILRAGGAATSLTMNCSGKHAAMLRTCVVNGWSTDDYLDPAHPVQVACQRTIEALAGEPVLHVAIDGCGAPQHAVSLTGLARAFGRLAGPDAGGSSRRTAEAMRAHPWYVGGTGRDVTALMEGLPGLVAKDGAEGVYAVGLPDGSAVALKVDDGAERARMPVLVAALRALGFEADVLEQYATRPVLGGGRRVGEVRVAF